MMSTYTWRGAEDGTGDGVLRRLVGDTDAFREHWERSPMVAETDDSVQKAFPLERAFSLLETPGLPVSCFRLFRDGAPVPQEEFTTVRGRPGPGREAVADGAVLREAHERGATIVFEEVRLLVTEVDALARALEEELGFGVYCAAFLTPEGNPGVRPHYDLASGLLCQIHGSKSWSVGEPAVVWPTLPCGDSCEGFTPVLRTELHPGRSLYIPRGHPHAGAATEELSLHLSFAIKPRTWKDVLQAYLKGDGPTDQLRELLPTTHGTMSQEELVTEAIERLRAPAPRPA